MIKCSVRVCKLKKNLLKFLDMKEGKDMFIAYLFINILFRNTCILSYYLSIITYGNVNKIFK